MKLLLKTGIAISVAALLLFLTCLFGGRYTLTSQVLHQSISDPKHLGQVEPAASSMLNKEYTNVFSFTKDFRNIINNINEQNRAQQKWDQVIYTDYTFFVTKNSNHGWVRDHNVILLILILFCTIIGSLLYIIPKYAFTSKGIHNNRIWFDKLNALGWIGIVLGVLLMLFYITLYFFPEYITNWVILVDPLSRRTNGHDASQWYLYGFLYTIAVVVMGIRMLLKYRGNLYQQVRTDCNDDDSSIHPLATEICNNVDDNCNLLTDDGLPFVTYYADVDDDNYGDPLASVSTCNGAPPNYVTDSTDCNDANAGVNPGVLEISNNGVDDNCNGAIDEFGVGIGEMENNSSLTISPNPATSVLTLLLQLQGSSAFNAEITIMNVLGERVFEKLSPFIQGILHEEITIDKKFPQGIYLVQVSTDNLKWSRLLTVVE